MNDFEFYCPTKIIFGKEKENDVGKELSDHNPKKVLLHYGKGSIKRNGLYDKVVNALNEEGIEFIELSGVVPNPRLSLVREGIELCRKEGVDFILAVGGGSVIDSAKAIAVGVPYEGDVWDFYLKGKAPEKALPIATILTIPAAGSEASPATVITDEENGRKLSFKNNIIRPVFSILNPEYTINLPLDQTAYGIADMLAHLFERYFTNTKSVDFTDKLLEGAMRSIIKNGKALIKDPKNYDLRSEIMLAGYVAHNGSLDIGRETDWATHLVEHELSAFYDIPHGAGLAVMFPAWMKFTYKHDPERFAQFAEEVWGIRQGAAEEKAIGAISALEDFYHEIGLKTRLSDLGIDDSKFEEMGEELKVTKGIVGNFVKIGKKEAVEIYRLAL